MTFKVEKIQLAESNRQLVVRNMVSSGLVIGVYDTRTPDTLIVAVRNENPQNPDKQLTFFRVVIRRQGHG